MRALITCEIVRSRECAVQYCGMTLKPSVRTNYGISTFKFSAIKIWESDPPELKRFSHMLFKKRYKRLKTDHSLTVSYITNAVQYAGHLFLFILTCIYVCLTSLMIILSFLI